MHDPAQLVGRRAAGPIGEHEIITARRLVSAHLVDGLERGLVAAPVRLDDPHALDLVRAGDHVDLLEAARTPDIVETVAPTPHVATLVANALVLAVFPAAEGASAEFVLAVERVTALRITRDSASQVFTAVVVPP
jgi:hypothetical protein